MQLEQCQGLDAQDREFGYVYGDDGGFFFTWMRTLEDTLASIEEDAVDGAGDLDADDVREFLSRRLPQTQRGMRLGW